MLARRTVLGAAMVALLTACGAEEDPPGDAARIDGELVGRLREDDAEAVAQAVNAFGFDLLKEADGSRLRNTVTSPVSVAVLLAMVLAGADGDTARDMARTLHLTDARDVRAGALLRMLADTDDVTLSVANALWAARGTPLRGDYLDFVTGTFGATAKEADLAARATADEIDRWASDRTEGRIPAIARDLGLPSADTVLVLLNAVYFLGTWTVRFDTEATREEPFTLTDGRSAAVPMMSLREEKLGYAERDGYAMLRLPYGKERRYGMEVLLPAPGSDLGALLDRLGAAEWAAGVAALREEHVHELALPRFALTWSLELNAVLDRLGMGAAFGPEADFSRMSPTNPVLSKVVHKTYIRVDENGTEAAAVTGGAMKTSLPLNPIVFRADRPFAFTVSDRRTGAALFLGTVTDPRG
ncbi:serpin family protein [Streptomyces formicae]|uniref:Serpin family protein n=1 Tax=Streptomyces formicae TaxID=1616117 RepID=A0ABY3WTD0_9ACTN|nr:serpin family protein [Streptomyces formicae]UNM14816.1 serpin family protein [Streptomyces formicae]